jgi:hypothetical protein
MANITTTTTPMMMVHNSSCAQPANLHQEQQQQHTSFNRMLQSEEQPVTSGMQRQSRLAVPAGAAAFHTQVDTPHP